jgi:hypothetical protein
MIIYSEYTSLNRYLRIDGSGVPSGPGSPVPIVVSLDTTTTMTIRFTCLIPTVIPTSSTITSLPLNGQIFQNNNGRNGGQITSFPAVVTSSTNDVRYIASNRSSFEEFNYTVMCNGVSQIGLVQISVASQAVAQGGMYIYVYIYTCVYI